MSPIRNTQINNDLITVTKIMKILMAVIITSYTIGKRFGAGNESRDSMAIMAEWVKKMIEMEKSQLYSFNCATRL